MGTVSAILLAAGESRRMGEENKLTLQVGGTPLVRHCAQVLLASRLVEMVVVLGYDADAIAGLLVDLPLRALVNHHYAKGQMTSVDAGLISLTQPCDGFMVCLSDQPLLEPRDINDLIDAFAGRERGSVLVPLHDGRRGNPVILSWAHRDTILFGNRKLGCRRFIEKNPALVTTIEFPNDHVIRDLDTPEDYARITARLQSRTARGEKTDSIDGRIRLSRRDRNDRMAGAER